MTPELSGVFLRFWKYRVAVRILFRIIGSPTEVDGRIFDRLSLFIDDAADDVARLAGRDRGDERRQQQQGPNGYSHRFAPTHWINTFVCFRFHHNGPRRIATDFWRLTCRITESTPDGRQYLSVSPPRTRRIAEDRLEETDFLQRRMTPCFPLISLRPSDFRERRQPRPMRFVRGWCRNGERSRATLLRCDWAWRLAMCRWPRITLCGCRRDRPRRWSPVHPPRCTDHVGRSDRSGSVELVVRRPAHLADRGIGRQDFIERLLQSQHLARRVDFAEEPAKSRAGGLDETKKAVGLLPILPAANPQVESIVFDRQHPAPILRDRFAGLEALGAIPRRGNRPAACQKVRDSVSPHPRRWAETGRSET